MESPASDAACKRMRVNAAISPQDPRYSKVLELYSAAVRPDGKSLYDLKDAAEFEEIHCQKESTPWLANGFAQTYTTVDGKRCRVLAYLPNQELQPHRHDLDEEFLITHGAVDFWMWSADGARTAQHLSRGDRLSIPNGVVHGLRADSRSGLVFHELVAEDTFRKRSTEFVPRPQYFLPSQFAAKTVFITGANRGLGLGFAEALAKTGARVVAACRDVGKADGLHALRPQVTVIALDLASEASVQSLPGRVREAGVEHLDYLINNAGISSPDHPNDPILKATAEVVRQVFDVNVVGTMMVTQACLPLLEASETRVVVNLSSQLASIERCWGVQGRFGGVASYRVSRAASNMALRCFGGELQEQGYIFVAMSPGHVATDMGSAGGRTAPLSVEQSINGMLHVMAHLSPDDNGRFLQYDGQELPW